jgi:hypothetical protein
MSLSFNVPNVPIDPMFENSKDKIVLTSVGKDFFEQLIKYFMNNFSSEGLVSPTQTTANINTIVSNQDNKLNYTSGFGRKFYNSTTNSMQVTINNGSGVPVIKTFTLT